MGVWVVLVTLLELTTAFSPIPCSSVGLGGFGYIRVNLLTNVTSVITLKHRILFLESSSAWDWSILSELVPSLGISEYCLYLENWIAYSSRSWGNYSLSMQSSDPQANWCVRSLRVFSPSHELRFSMFASDQVSHVNYNETMQCIRLFSSDSCWTKGVNFPYCNCVRGEFQSSSNSNLCQGCSSGKYSRGVVRASACTDCEPGRFLADSHGSSCLACDPGRFTGGFGATSCTQCPRSGFAPSSASANCTSCPTGKISLSVASTSQDACSVCSQGFFGNRTICTRCPDLSFVSCPEDILYPIVPPGVWMSKDDPRDVITCFPKEACLNTTDGLTSCTHGYQDVFCSSCSKGFYRLDGYCIQCPGIGRTVGFGFLFFICFFVALYFLLRSASPYTRKINSIGIAIGWIQVIGVYSSLPVDWPPEIQSVFQIASASNLNMELSAPECSVKSDFWTTQYLMLCIPFLFAAFLALVYGIQRLVALKYPSFPNLFLVSREQALDWFNNGNLPKTLPDAQGFRRYLYAYIFFLTFFYTQICSVLMKMVSCLRLEDGKYYMTHALDIRCGSQRHEDKILFPMIFFGLLYVIGIPLSFGIIFYKNRNNIYADSVMTIFGGIIGPYKVSLFWYELIHLLRKLLTVVCLYVVTSREPTLRVFLCLLVLSVFLCLQYSQNPFKVQSNNFLCFLWMLVSIFCLFSGVVFGEGTQRSSERIFAVLVITLFVFSCAFSVLAAYLEIKHFQHVKQFGRDFSVTAELGRNRALTLAEFEIQRGKLDLFKSAFPGFGDKIFDNASMLDLKTQERFINRIQQYYDRAGGISSEETAVKETKRTESRAITSDLQTVSDRIRRMVSKWSQTDPNHGPDTKPKIRVVPA